MLDNYKDSVDSDLFDKVKEYACTPEMLGYPILKTKFIMEAYRQVYGKDPIKSDISLPTNEQVNSMYSNNKSTVNTKRKVVFKNVNDETDTIETDVELNNISPNKEYQIKMGVEKQQSMNNDSSKVNEYEKIVNVDIESLDEVKGTSVLDKTVNYKDDVTGNNSYIIKHNDEEGKIKIDKDVSVDFFEM